LVLDGGAVTAPELSPKATAKPAVVSAAKSAAKPAAGRRKANGVVG
jgi:hypothetical protein